VNPPTGTNRPEWELDKTNPDLANTLKPQLSEVKDLELDLNVVELGLIRNATLQQDQVVVEMILTTPFCPYGPAMIDMVWQKTEEALNLPATVVLGAEVWDFSMAEEGLLDDWGLY